MSISAPIPELLMTSAYPPTPTLAVSTPLPSTPVTIIVTTLTIMSSTSVSQKRWGTHPIFGIYVEGTPLAAEHTLNAPHSYSSTSKIRSERSLNVAETSLHLQRINIMSLKFNGKMEVTE